MLKFEPRPPGKHTVRYTQDGVVETINLNKEGWRYAPTPPGEDPPPEEAPKPPKPCPPQVAQLGGQRNPFAPSAGSKSGAASSTAAAPPPKKGKKQEGFKLRIPAPPYDADGHPLREAAAPPPPPPRHRAAEEEPRKPPGVWPKADAGTLVEYSPIERSSAGAWCASRLYLRDRG